MFAKYRCDWHILFSLVTIIMGCRKSSFRKGNCSFVIQNVWQKEKERTGKKDRIEKDRGIEKERRMGEGWEEEEHLIYWRICKFHNFQRTFEVPSLC